MVRWARPPGHSGAAGPASQPGAAGRRRYQAWAALMERAFGLDVLACPRCGGRLRLIATIADPAVIEQILTHLGLSSGPGAPGPAPPAGTAVVANS